jgi:hypothetical protein
MSNNTPTLETTRRHTCACGWFRDVTTDKEMVNKRYMHLIYGLISYKEAAAKDIEAHDCEQAELSRRQLKSAREIFNDQLFADVIGPIPLIRVTTLRKAPANAS